MKAAILAGLACACVFLSGSLLSAYGLGQGLIVLVYLAFLACAAGYIGYREPSLGWIEGVVIMMVQPPAVALAAMVAGDDVMHSGSTDGSSPWISFALLMLILSPFPMLCIMLGARLRRRRLRETE